MAKPKGVSPGVQFARRVREVREHRGWDQGTLARRRTELGYPTDRTTINRLERGGADDATPATRTRAENVSLDEVLVTAAALGVSPLHLFVPIDEKTPLRVGNLEFTPLEGREWVRGITPPFPLQKSDAQSSAVGAAANTRGLWRMFNSEIADTELEGLKRAAQDPDLARRLGLLREGAWDPRIGFAQREEEK